MFTEPIFWTSLVLLILIGMLFAQHEQLRGQFATVLEHDKKVKELATALLPFIESKQADLSLQSDTDVHHEWELIRLRESVLELASDLKLLAEYQAIKTAVASPGVQLIDMFGVLFGSENAAKPEPSRTLLLSNHVFERHTRLPDDLPASIKEQYQAGNWTCPVCESEIDNCWTGWCPTCGRLTAPMTQMEKLGGKTDPAPDHEPTSPGLGFYEEFTCFACHKPFLLTQHPLAAVCPHCNARQIDVGVAV